MKYVIITLFLSCLCISLANAEKQPLTRVEGLTRIWVTLKRPVERTNEPQFNDVPEYHPQYDLIKYTKARGIVDDKNTFEPDAELRINDALIWLLRSRNVTYPDDVTYETLINFITLYPTKVSPDDIRTNPRISQNRLTEIMEALDTALQHEEHIVSYYAENFAGRNTAFGEKFDPNALTAAHRTLPHNTLVRVTNTENGRNVTVRINDRGPYIDGRDMDLSRAAFSRIGSLSHGILNNVTFERVGTSQEDLMCTRTRYQKRLGGTILSPGIPTVVKRGTTIELTADGDMCMIQMRPPRSRPLRSREWKRSITISFDRVGVYSFVMQEDGGRRRRFRTRVVDSCMDFSP